MPSIKLKNIKQIVNQGNRYNLEIEKNNNYFANNILVHNCRCLAFLRDDKVVLLSRQRKEFNHLQHLRDQLLPLFQKNPNLVLDGELYSHQYTFQDIISAIKRDEPNELTENIEYHVYDIVSNLPFQDRHNTLVKLSFEFGPDIIKVMTDGIKSKEMIDFYYKEFVEGLGFEGLMIRNASGKYKQDGRSQDLLKYKKFLDMEFPITGADQNKGKLSNTCTFRCTHNGTEFNVMCEGSQEEREQLYTDWKNGIIKEGDLLTVKFFAWTNSEKPVPRFPIGRFKYNT